MNAPEQPEISKPSPFTSRSGPRRGPLSQDKARRQGDITSLAFLHLGGRDAAIAFLNNIDAELGGRPLDIAMTSDEGSQRVSEAILRLANLSTGRR